MRGTKHALSKATVMRAKILSVTPLNPLGVTAPLTSKGSRERVQFASVAIPYQNVCAVRTLICFSCAEGALHAPKARFMCRRHASCAEGTLHLRHACAVILSFPPAQSGSGDTGKADRAAVKIPPSTPPAEQSPCRKTASALDNHRSQK